MAAPAFQSVGTYLEGSAGTADVAVPAGVAAGDLVVVVLYVNASTSVTAMPAGFATAPDSPVINTSGNPHRLHVAWKRATGSDTGVYSFTLSGTDFRSGGALRYSGVIDSGSPWDVTASANSGDATSQTTPAVSVTTTGADRMLVFGGTNWSGGVWTPPSGFNERIDAGSFHVMTADDLVQATAGSSGTVQATCAGTNRTVAWLGALLPQPTVYTKSGGGVAAGAGSGAETVTHAAVYAKSGGGAAAGVGVGVETVTHPAVIAKSGGAVSVGAGIAAKIVVHPATWTKAGGAVATCVGGSRALVPPQVPGWPPLVAGPCAAPLLDIRGPFREPLMWVCGPTPAPLMLIRKLNSAIFVVRPCCTPKREGPLILPPPNNGEGFSQGVSQPTMLVQIAHGLPFTPAGISCIDTTGDTVIYASVTNPQLGVTEVTFGVPFTGVIYLS